VDRGALQEFAEALLQPSDEVALESTTDAWAVADLVEPNAANVVVTNALPTKGGRPGRRRIGNGARCLSPLRPRAEAAPSPPPGGSGPSAAAVAFMRRLLGSPRHTALLSSGASSLDRRALALRVPALGRTRGRGSPP